MKPTLTAFLASSCLLAVACGGGGTESELDAVFSDADTAHLQRVHAAATLQDVSIPLIFALFLDPASTCPSVAIDGDVTTVTGGCTTEDGVEFLGSARFVNREGLLADSGAGEVVLEYDDFGARNDGDTFLFAGEIRLDLAGNDGSISMRSEYDGIWTHLAADIECNDADECEFAEGAIVEVQDVGAAALSGTYANGEAGMSGQLVLEGAEVLILDLDGTDDAGCVPISIDGEDAGQICPDSE